MSYISNISLEPDAQAQVIDADSFGARYVSLRGFDRFLDQIGQTDVGMIVWPGGALAENNDERYGIQYEDLYSGDYDRPGLSDLMALARDEHLSLSIILPTARYEDDLDGLRVEATDFFTDLFSGTFGELPEKLVMEMGNEFYANFHGVDEAEKAEHYAAVVNTYAEVLHELETQFDVHPENVEYSIQLGRTEDGNAALIEAMSKDALTLPDMLSTHRFTYNAEGADRAVDVIEAAHEMWSDTAEELGGEGPGLYLSAYNAASLSRVEAAEDFLSTHDHDGLTIDDLDLDGRSNLEFEQHYQDMLATRAMGMEHAETILQTFADYHAIGAEAAGVYGWDLTHSGSSSYTDVNGEAHIFVGGQIQDMMAESLNGTRILNWHDANDHSNDDAGTAYAFDSADKLVLFLGAPKTLDGPQTVQLDLRGLGDTAGVWGQSLHAEVPEDWHILFDVPVVEGVDQTPESLKYAEGIRDQIDLTQDGNVLSFDFTRPDEMVRLVFARSDAGIAEISEWADGAMLSVDPDAFDDTELTADDATIDTSGLMTHDMLPDELFSEDAHFSDDDAEEEDDAMSAEGDAGGDDGGDMGGLLAALVMGLMAAAI